MKKILLSVLFFVSMFAFTSNAQCGDELLKEALKEMGDSQYLKDFTIDLTKAKKDVKTGYVKYSVILNSRSQYRFSVANSSSNRDNVIMQLFDGDKLMTSNFQKGKFYSSVETIIGKTKVYTLLFSFRGGDEGCARAVQSLVKQYTAAEMK